MTDNMQMVVALYDYAAQDHGELSIKKNEKLLVIDDRDQWWKVQNERAMEGLVPSTYVERKNSLKSKKKLIDKIMANKKSCKDVPAERLYAAPQDSRISEAKKVETSAFVKFNYTPAVDDELALTKGERVIITRKNDDGWWYGSCNGRSGWLPSNYVIEETNEPFQAKPSGKLSTSSSSSNIICKVKAMYDFNSVNEEELNFEQGQILDVIEQPADDPEWWMARAGDGREGLVPITFVQIIPEGVAKIESLNSYPRPSVESFTNEPWYYGSFTRDMAEDCMLRSASDGDYLVRSSGTQAGDYAVSVKTPQSIKHFRVQCRDKVYHIGQRTFNSMHELIDHYRRAPIVTINNGQKMYLVRPFSQKPGARQ